MIECNLQKQKINAYGIVYGTDNCNSQFSWRTGDLCFRTSESAIAVPIVAAIAIHNIPEGIAVSIPIYQSTGSKIKAFRYSFLSGLAEPVGALVGWLILIPVMNDVVFGIIFAVVAGIMVFISFDELLPAAREYGEHHLSLYGLIAGMAVMGISLLLFLWCMYSKSRLNRAGPYKSY